jgi:CRISPR-associated endonuclease/helicase Cas3
MSTFSEEEYRTFFQSLTGNAPFDYQVKVARLLLEEKNIVLRAPTGAGKTWAVLAPFLFLDRQRLPGCPARLIYALPLRTLAQGVYRGAQEAARQLGQPVEGQVDARGREILRPYVTLQTGEQPDDRFFDRGTIIVTTYDQVLSGLLDGPYGLSNRLHNVNAAAVAGALVVFDEFHLMEPHKAFLTAVAGLHLFRDLCQSVWMTATATQSLDEVLADALSTVSVPASDAETDALLNSLPSVTTVTRRLVVESAPLSAEAVLRCHHGCSLVLLNTVARAQAMYADLRQVMTEKGFDATLILLHSRFFKEDRRAKEGQLHALFGKRANGSAILVATQVVEAGLDLSCEHLHTELCPMNSLVQRGGRCARFVGEEGTVHVYPLPAEKRAWLPYGDVQSEDVTLSKTRELLKRIGQGILHPCHAAAWVQEVHGEEDERALREGWWSRLSTCLQRINQNAILRDPKRVADLIRGEDTDSVRVIISEETRRPENPGQREGLNLSRRSLYRLFENSGQDIGWYWDGADDIPWKALQVPTDCNKTYVVCLRPAVVAYESDIGLRLGIAGRQESPDRHEPPRPGYAPLRAEPWAAHAQAVAAEARKRLEREHSQTGLLGRGFERRYGLTPEAINAAVAACALLHDLGKLQENWQRWAEAAQKAQSSTYRHVTPLAHTDFDPDSPEDRERERRLSIRRPAHAPASAYYGRAFLGRLLAEVPANRIAYVASACAAAILAHHGGWWPRDLESDPPKLWSGWEAALVQTLGWLPETKTVRSLQKSPMDRFLGATTGADSLAEWWPLVAYLTRTLRLADQRATAERACHE